MAVALSSTTVGRICIVGAAGEPQGRLEQLLGGHGMIVWGVKDAGQVAEPLYPSPDVVLIDARGDAGAALAALAALQGDQRLGDATPLVLLPALPDGPLLELLTITGADFLVAPVSDAELLVRLTLAVGRSGQRRRDRQECGRLAQEQAGQQRALDEQRALAARFRAIFEHLPIGALIVSATNQIEAVNGAFCRFLGYSPEELIGRQPAFVTSPEDHVITTAQGFQLAAGQIDHFVHERRRHLRKDGSVALGRLTSVALRDDRGRPQAFLAFIEDISGRVLIENQLARQTRYQQALADASLSLLSVAPDPPARAAALTRALQQLVDGAATSRAYLFRNVQVPQIGLAISGVAEAWSAGQRPLTELSGAKIFPVVPYALLPEAHRQRLLAPMPSGGLVDELYGESPELCAVIKADGIRSTQTVPVFVDGAHWGFVGLDDHTQPRAWDHTDLMLLTAAATMLGQTLHRWQIEDDLHATSRLLQTTGQVARVGGWTFDLASGALTISEELARLLEVAPEAVGDFAALLAFCAPEARPALQEAAQTAIRSGRGWELELPFVTARGQRLWFSSQGQAERSDGRTLRLFGTAQDVTRRKAAELELERQLRIETGLARCSQELLAPMALPANLGTVATPALEQLRIALEVDQAYLMQLVDDPADPYFTIVAFASVPITIVADEHPLARRFPLSLLPPSHRQALDAGEPVIGLPRREELLTPAQHAWLDQDQAQTRISLPLRINGRLWGILGFNGLSPREWGLQEQTVLRTATEMLSHVIQRWLAAEELRRSEEQFRTAVETMLDGFAILESVREPDGSVRDFRFRYINEVGSLLNQRSREEHLGHSLLELLPAHRDTDLFADYVRLVETGVPLSRESMIYEDVYGSGERLVRVVDVRAARLGDGLAIAWRDVTDRHLAHQSLAQANDDLLHRVNELRTLNLIAQTLAATQDLHAGLQTVCNAVATRTGAAHVAVACFEQPGRPPERGPGPESGAPAELLVLAPDELGPLGPTLLTARHSLTVSREQQHAALSERALRRLGCATAAHLLIAPLTSATGSLGLLALGSGPNGRPFSPDDQRLIETAAGQIATAISNARLAEQAQQAARLAERNRVARDLHDSATQALYSLTLLAGGWAMQAEQGRLTEVPARFTQLGEIALQVLKELRLLIYELRHPELAEVGLAKALENRLAAVEQRASVRTSLAVSGQLDPLPQYVEEQVYTLLQEALNNALRHAQARTVAVSIRVEPEQVLFAVRDDGVGFAPEAPSSGLGISSMRERAAAIGARLTLTSAPNAGTQVELRLPRHEPRGSNDE